MHDFDRTSLESEMGAYESDEYGYEFEGEGGPYGEVYSESPFNEADEMELAAELLSVSNEYEMDQFLGKLFKKASGALGKVLKSPIGKSLGGMVKTAAGAALPMLASTVGNAIVPGLGGMIGGQLASSAGSMLGLELEGLSQEDQEFEAARQIVRLAGAAASHAADAPPNAPPQQVAQSAVTKAAQQFAPGLLRSNGASNGKPATQGTGGTNGCQHPRSGRWIRKGRSIVLLGA